MFEDPRVLDLECLDRFVAIFLNSLCYKSSAITDLRLRLILQILFWWRKIEVALIVLIYLCALKARNSIF